MDLRFVELMPTAKVIIEESLALKPDEKLVIVTDTRISEFMGTEPLIEALMAAARLVGNDPLLMTYTTRTRSGEAPPPLFDEAILHADAMICVGTFHFVQLPTMNRFRENGGRVLTLPGGSNVWFEGNRADDKIYRILPKSKEDFYETVDLTRRVGNKFIGNHTIHVTSPSGTDVTLATDTSMLQNVCTGLCREPGTLGFLPGAQTCIITTEGSANGKIVIDGSLYPMQRLLKEPVIYDVKDGFVTSITGGADAEEFRRLVESNPYQPACRHVSEIGTGMHPRAKLQGDSFEDERLYGSVHFGIGNNAGGGGTMVTGGFHCDGIIKNATIEIDGELIFKEGEILV